ncbi:MAG: YkgJ family cysteine cluster protein [Planctomycetota bacterium]
MPKKVKDPWYADGLRFGCTACGGCCGGFPGFVWVSDEEAEVLGARFDLSAKEFRAEYCRRVGTRWTLRETGNWNCVLLVRGKCRVYDDRPVQCRTFPFWDENLDCPEDWARAARHCPGMDSGPTLDFAEIERLRCDRHED